MENKQFTIVSSMSKPISLHQSYVLTRHFQAAEAALCSQHASPRYTELRSVYSYHRCFPNNTGIHPETEEFSENR